MKGRLPALCHRGLVCAVDVLCRTVGCSACAAAAGLLLCKPWLAKHLC